MKNRKNFLPTQMLPRKQNGKSLLLASYSQILGDSLASSPPQHFQQADNLQLSFIILTLKFLIETEKGWQASAISEPVLWPLSNPEPNSQATGKVPVLLQTDSITQSVYG